MPIWQKFILKVLSVFFIILICGNLHITGWCGQTNMSTSDMSWYAEPDYVVHIDAATAPDTKTTAGNQSVRFPGEGHTQGTNSQPAAVGNPNITFPGFYASRTIHDAAQFNDLWELNNMGQKGGTVDADIDAPEAWDITTGSSDNDMENAANSGASMDTTHVSGAAALDWDPFPDYTPDEMMSLLTRSVDPMNTLSGKMPSGGSQNVYKYLFVLTMILYAAGAMFALCFFKWQIAGNYISFICSAIASCCSIALSVAVLFNGAVIRLDFLIYHAIIKYNFLLDPLASFFMLAISGIGFIASVYSLGYTRLYVNKRDTRFLGFTYNLFLLSMLLVVTANNALVFMIVWETMTLVSFFLVIFEHENEANRKAGFVYIVMAHVGSGLLAVAFFIMSAYAGTFTFSFDDFRHIGAQMPGIYKNIVFFLVIAGFGIKAGIFPLHLWLPLAHPAAPSNVSMVMSGVMIKTAIYGFIRFYFEFLTPCPPWWGIVILIIGATSTILGVLYALMQHDMKTLLAYHSIENIGIILIGIGLSMIFKSYNLMALSSLAMIAGLYHVINHAVFKCLLFGCAGNIYYSTHTNNIEEFGGLIKRLQITAPLFLVGALSISTIPPLNGFMSEWLIFQSILNSFNLPSVFFKIITVICGATLALAGGLAAACFIKAFGISFLALPRSEHAKKAKEVPIVMLVSMGFLAALCVFMGLFPAKIMTTINQVNTHLLGTNIIHTITLYDWLQTRSVHTNFTELSPKSASVFGLILFAVTFGVLTLLRPGFTKKIYETWTCGISPEPRFGYTATAFTKPFKVIFSNLYRPRRESRITYAVPKYFVKSITYIGEITPIFEKYFYNPISSYVLNISNKVRWVHTGSIHVYLVYIFVTLIIAIMFYIYQE